MTPFYETRYMINYNEYSQNTSIPSLMFDIQRVYILMTNKSDALVIDVNRWKYIALIHVNSYNTDKLLSAGAKWVKSSNLYENTYDVKIQMAYICAKYLIEPKDVYTITEGLLMEESYTKLVKMFYDEWPEKFI